MTWKASPVPVSASDLGAAYVHRRSGNAVLAQRSAQRSLIDEIATGKIDKERVRVASAPRRPVRSDFRWLSLATARQTT